MLIGNKCDLEAERQVDKEKAKAYAEKHQIAFMETSATQGINVELAGDCLVNEVYRVLKKNGEIEQSMNTSNPTGVYKSKKPTNNAIINNNDPSLSQISDAS